MDLSVPWLFASLVVGSVGLGVFLYGKKAGRLPHVVSGLALMLASWIAPSAAWMIGSSVALIAALWYATRHLGH